MGKVVLKKKPILESAYRFGLVKIRCDPPRGGGPPGGVLYKRRSIVRSWSVVVVGGLQSTSSYWITWRSILVQRYSSISLRKCESAKVVYSNVENWTEVNASAILLVARRVVPPPALGVFQVGELLTLDYTDR